MLLLIVQWHYKDNLERSGKNVWKHREKVMSKYFIEQFFSSLVKMEADDNVQITRF